MYSPPAAVAAKDVSKAAAVGSKESPFRYDPAAATVLERSLN